MRQFTVDKLQVNVSDSRTQMGLMAAEDAARALKKLLDEKDVINVIFAAAPSQNEMLASLIAHKEIDWTRINAFHMDEYIGLPADAPQGFGNFLRRAIFERVPFRSVSYLNGLNPDIEAECARYSALLEQHPTDVVLMGIGENGHIAFNDPPVADFHDKRLVKPVELDSVCRHQQVNDGCFASLDQVPTHALTLTVPALMRGGQLFCVVPAPTKAEAVYRTLHWEVSEACPATALRTHDCARLYLDPDSASKL